MTRSVRSQVAFEAALMTSKNLSLHSNDLFLGETTMDFKKRLLLSLGILAIDLLVFFLPLTAFFLAYIILFNPQWARDFLNNLDRPPGTGSPPRDQHCQGS
jgi:hypothetical protein